MNGPVVLMNPERRQEAMRSLQVRHWKNRIFLAVCLLTAAVSLLILVVLLGAIAVEGLPHLSLEFLRQPPSPEPSLAGIGPTLWGTVAVCVVCAAFTLPIGVASAIFLQEFQPRNPHLRRIHSFVQLNISNLAGVPSIVYGILGLTAFVGMFGLFGSPANPAVEFGVQYYDQYLTEGDRVVLVPADNAEAEPTPLAEVTSAVTPGSQPVQLNVIPSRGPLPDDPELRTWTIRADSEGGRISRKSWYYTRIPFGRGVLAGGLTLMLVILPVLIISSQEALRAVPDSLRDGALGLGATRLQTIRRVTLPAAIPGIMTGSIISMSRAIGEAAPILMISGIVFITSPPRHLMDDFAVLPLQIFNWTTRPQQAFHDIAAGGILVLLAVLLTFNAIAVLIRHKLQKPLS